MTRSRIKRKLRAWPRRLREVRMFAKAMRSAEHPILAHIIPTRRCNLSCAYCNEYDHVSQPVPMEEMLRRMDRLAALGTSIITISGGEPLLHPDLDLIVRRIRDHKHHRDADYQRVSAERRSESRDSTGRAAPSPDQHR